MKAATPGSFPGNDLVGWLQEHRSSTLGSYRSDRLLIKEHANQEESFRKGGYADRQLLELIQNSADALHRSGRPGRVELRLTADSLYCANEGEPFTRAGLEAVCHAFLSDKRGEEIGRFGLGFKSVLGVSDNPAVYSRSVSFGFSEHWSREDLGALDPTARRFPVLRLPRVLDLAEARSEDVVLDELAGWAETVVHLPLRRGAQRIAEEMTSFRNELLLFVPGISDLRLSARTEDVDLDVSHRCVRRADGVQELIGRDGETRKWRVWYRRLRPSPEALAEVGETIRRDEVQVSWAAPLDDSQQLGQLWAFFPLKDVTSTRGLINAPWRINDDRTNLLWGRFNEELCQVAAELVAEGLSALSSEDDPARHFDYLPARGREAPNDADRYLTRAVPELCVETPCIPDAKGDLQRPGDLRFPHFELRLDVAPVKAWHAAPGRPVAAPHWSCYRNPVRIARLRTLLRRDDRRASEVELSGAAWLESLVPESTDEQCAAALLVVDEVEHEPTRRELLAARVVPDGSGTLRRLDETGDVFLRGDILSATAGLSLVRTSYLALEGVESVLGKLGFVDVDPRHELARLTRQTSREWGEVEWRAFWGLVEEVPRKEALALLEEHVRGNGHLRVLCADGQWQPIGDVVAPGMVRPKEPSLILDVDFHGTDLLDPLGAPGSPGPITSGASDPTYVQYLGILRNHYLKQLPARGRPEPQALNIRKSVAVGPLHMLRRFADTEDAVSQERWTRALLELELPPTVEFGHQNKRLYPPIQVTAPHLWAAKRYGLLPTTWGPRPPAMSLGRGLSRFASLLPVTELDVTGKMRLADDMESVPVDVLREFLTRTPEGVPDPELLATLLAEALPRTGPAEVVPALSASSGCLAPIGAVLVARTEDELTALIGVTPAVPSVFARDDAQAEILYRFGLRPAADSLRVELVPEDPQEAVLLLDRYRGLRSVTQGELDVLELVQCSDLARQVTSAEGIDRQAVRLARSGNRVFYVSSLTDTQLLELLAEDLGLGLDSVALARIGADAQDEQVKLRAARCRTEMDPVRKLLTLLPAPVLESHLPAGLLQTVRRLGEDSGNAQVAQLLLHVHGFEVLRELRHELLAMGMPVPKNWAGSAPAVAFVRSLGFPAEYACDRNQNLEADLSVLGPPRLPPLHDYQVDLAGQVRYHMRSPERAMLFLPTGAGKTRVTVEALTHAFLEDGLVGPLLWIAQSEELCEQAVQTWSTVWRQFGDDRPMRIGRLWSRNEVASSDDEVFVIIATDAKLAECLTSDEYDWVAAATGVVIDEAHEATGTQYTKILRWLGIDARRTERPLLGLTATPFKGTGDEATKRLVGRFGETLLDSLGEDPYGRLQSEGVLSRVEHQTLDGADVELDTSEASETLQTRRLPSSVMERIGRNEARTGRLLDHITALPEDWPVLVFTADVLSAQVLAALLRVKQVPAAAVSGMTRMNERRRSIDQFRRGEIRVLTNCNVLTQGFDAPAVRALYIARPTFSPNAYIQMVGRGLRGKANGGKEECLVVNVNDTFGKFGEELAYRKFDYLWKRQGGQLS